MSERLLAPVFTISMNSALVSLPGSLARTSLRMSDSPAVAAESVSALTELSAEEQAPANVASSSRRRRGRMRVSSRCIDL